MRKASFSYMQKPFNSLLKHWLPTTSILFLIETTNSEVIIQKTKNFSYIFFFFLFAFLKYLLNFENFQKKMTLIADVIPKLGALKNVVRYMHKKSRFSGPFESQHGKRAQILLKSKGQHRCHIYCSIWTWLSWKKSLLVIWKTL